MDLSKLQKGLEDGSLTKAEQLELVEAMEKELRTLRSEDPETYLSFLNDINELLALYNKELSAIVRE